MVAMRCLVILNLIGLRSITVVADCIDKAGSCPFWATIHECSQNPKFMMCVCKLSCNTSSDCSGDGVNADTYCGCAFDAARGLCEHGDLMAKCPQTCSLRQNIKCGLPPSFPNANAVGNRMYLDRVTYVCRYGYRNDGDVGLTICNEAGLWRVSNEYQGKPPKCVADPSLVIPCEEMDFSFNQVSRTSVNHVGILYSRQGYSVADCLSWCQRVPGCTHAVYVTGKCLLYYHFARIPGKIDEGDVFERKHMVEPVFYYT